MPTKQSQRLRQELRRHRRHVTHLPPLRTFDRVLLVVLGWLLILVGILGLVLPGLQGILTLLFGAAILSLVSETVLTLLRWCFHPWPRGWKRLLRLRRRVHAWFSRDRR